MTELEAAADAPIAHNLRAVRERIEAARRRGGWEHPVRLVAVTKGRSAAQVREALAAGLDEIGENRVQEARAKWPELAGELAASGTRRHLVGHLQRNKVAAALELFDVIQSVDSLPLASKIGQSALDRGGAAEVLVQVNGGRERQKHGFDPDELGEAAERVAATPGLRLAGVMALAPLQASETELRAIFGDVRGRFERVRGRLGQEVRDLSMGMSGDFEAAVEEGATMVRIGSALFVGR